jgi:hypothetical protein
MNLNTDNWREFNIYRDKTQKGLFDIVTCKCGCAGDLDDGNDINYIGAKKNENGVMRKVKLEPQLVSKGNGILFICDGEGSVGYTNYIDKDFIGSTTVSVGYDEMLNNVNAMFIVTLLDKEKYKFSYGRKYRANIKKITIKLPVLLDDNNKPIISKNKYSQHGYLPDWTLMELYIKSLKYQPITTAIKRTAIPFDSNMWKEFLVSDVFYLYNGKGITQEEIEENSGNFIAIQSGEGNNGIIGKIDKRYCIEMDYTLTDEPCLTVARTGSAGFVSYQRFGCVVGDSAKILLLKNEENRNSYIYLFLKTILMANKYKYTYGRKVTERKYMKEKIRLPAIMVNGEKTPDWVYMEQYIKSLPYGDRI